MSADAMVWFFITILVVLFWGTPDIHDGILSYLMK
jgi:hypothetical protein